MHHPQAESRNGFSREELAQSAPDILARLRARAPRIHCVTNAVAQNFTANVLLAAGCIPSMTLSPEEIGAFVAGAQGLLVNLGTFDAERRGATKIAVDTAARAKLPWVLDPVFVDRAPPRAAFARELIGKRPAVVRLNHAEFAALAGNAPSRDQAIAYARANGILVALSGETDLVTDGERAVAIGNGHALMAKVIAHAPDRAGALARLRGALARLDVQGPTTNLPLLLALLDAPAITGNRVTTRWLEDHLAELMEAA